MTTRLIWDNLVAYSLQIGLLIGLAAFVPTLLRLRLPRARLVYWHLLLAACLLLPAVRPWRQEAISGDVQVTTTILAVQPVQPAPRPTIPLSGIALLLLAAGMVVRLGWLAVGFWRLRQYRRHSLPLRPANAWSVEADLRISGEVPSPVTFGFFAPVVLLPARFPELDQQVREAILCHEVLHVRRKDWLFTLAEELVRSVFWFHPAVWWLLGEIGLAREQAVDREVIELTKSRDRYVDALLAIAGASYRLDVAPAPLFLRKRHLKQRVVSILKEVRMSKTRSVSALAAGLGILAAACWFVTAAFPLMAAPQSVSDAPGVVVETGGAAILHRTSVAYPEAALRQRVAGTVTVEVTLDGSGNVADARVISGPAELRKAALQSVLQWHFSKDLALNTRQVNINFQLPPAAELQVRVRLPETDPANRAVAEEKVRALVSQMRDQQSQAAQQVDTVSRQEAQAKLAMMQANLAMLQRNIGPASLAGKPLKRIVVVGLSDQIRNDLLSRLPVHEGDILAADSYERVSRAVHEFDEHMNLNLSSRDGDVTFVITAASGNTERIVGPAPSSAAMASGADAPKRITIGGNVQQAKLISQPRPAYPALAKQARISGVVKLQAVIAADGTVKDLTVMSGHPLLVPAALESVRQWVYQQTLLNGEPVEVMTQIDVNFTLSE
jgi:TonB family protein